MTNNNRYGDKKGRGQVRVDEKRKSVGGGQVRVENAKKPKIASAQRSADPKWSVGAGQVQDKRSFKNARGEDFVGQQRGGRRKEERINGAPVYTATYTVNRSDELLEFLLRKCNTSRNNVKSLLVRKQVLVNGRVVTQYNFVLAKDDEVKISKRPVRDGETAKMPTAAKRNQRSVKFAIKVIYEDDDFVAIDKPVGLLSVESDKETESAYGYVLDHLQAQDKNARPFILHRIDKETSGVLLFAKNVKIHSMLKMHWNEQVQLREYFAVAEGVFAEKEGTITTYLKENVNNMVYSTKDPTGQKAITHFEVVKENAEYSLLKVKIDTGRKNQIRVHMQELGHPIVGDDKYGYTKNPLSRLGLHASKLAFIHPISKELITITAPLPPAFRGLF
ncbi:MAG: RluA family pseudouridine synthase [Clostridia bacterium]|nr:RluA family pseudouridine synthase [Clostridia bacterium]